MNWTSSDAVRVLIRPMMEWMDDMNCLEQEIEKKGRRTVEAIWKEKMSKLSSAIHQR